MNNYPEIICAELTAFFRRNGCLRRHDAGRYATQGCMKYKKGEEIRLVANGIEEEERILRRLHLAGFRAGRPFRKEPDRNQFCVPIYGREQVARFLKMVEETEKLIHASRCRRRLKARLTCNGNDTDFL